jgi:hypothetical protein
VRAALALLLVPGLSSAAPLKEGTPQLQLRVEAIAGQPTTQLGPRGGAGVGVGYRLTDQVWVVADAQTRAAPGGGVYSLAGGLQATLDMTPIEPYFELALVEFLGNTNALGYSLATRIGLGADYRFAPGCSVGAVVRTYTAFDTNDSALAGFEVALRFSFTPGER